jgi:transketolase
MIVMHTFGASAPLMELQRKFSFEPDRIVMVVKELLGRKVERTANGACRDGGGRV